MGDEGDQVAAGGSVEPTSSGRAVRIRQLQVAVGTSGKNHWGTVKCLWGMDVDWEIGMDVDMSIVLHTDMAKDMDRALHLDMGIDMDGLSWTQI